MQQVSKAWLSLLPTSILDGTKDIPLRNIFMLWIIATVIFSATLVRYLIDNREGIRAGKLSWIVIMVALCVFIVVGATAEEISLVFAPLTISYQMALSFFVNRE